VLGTGLVDPAQPIGLLLMALPHFMPDEQNPHEVLGYHRFALPPGSLLALSHIHVAPGDAATESAGQQVAQEYRRRTNHAAIMRSRDEIAAFFGEPDLVAPGLVWLPQWRPDTDTGDPAQASGLAHVH
jgi:hypothetical protein